MDKLKEQPATIDEYIAQSPPEVQPILQKIRETIRKAAPKAEERISYRMPAFFQGGPLVYFAPMKGYIGFYPTGSGIAAFQSELAGYVTTKGSVHLPLDKPMPYALIRKIVKFKVAENSKGGGAKYAKSAAKKSKAKKE